MMSKRVKPVPCWLTQWRVLSLIALLTLGVSACGFHLRGQLQMDPRYLPITVEDLGENAEFKPRLIRTLTESNIPVVEDSGAHLRILIDKISFEKHLVSADTTANIDTYDIGVKLRYKFKLNGEDILNWQELKVNRTLQFSKKAVVSSATEEVTLRDDLMSDAVAQIVTRLRYLDTLEREANKKTNKKDSGEIKDEPKT